MQLILNEISVSQQPINWHDINAALETFISVYSTLQKDYSNISRSVVVPYDINHLEISPGYSIAQWRNSHIDRDIKRRFLGFCDQMQALNPIEDELICETAEGIHGHGLQLAMEETAPLLSFSFQENWNSHLIPCTVYRVYDGDIISGCLHNFSTDETIIRNNDWLIALCNSAIQEIKSPNQLLEKLDSIFPSLYFIDNAVRQINRDLTSVTAPIVAEKLYKLESYFFDWDGEKFQEEAFPARMISPESTETLKAYKKEHSFLYGDQEILASLHMRYTGGNIPGRIYFYPDHETKKCVICSLTTKLPTVTEPKFRR